jgi:plastocyanin
MRLRRPRSSRALRLLLTVAAALALPALPALAPAPAEAATQTVTIGDNAFTPTTVDVAVGDTVTWTYPASGTTHHTITSEVGSWDAGTLNPGGSYSLVFNSPGTYHYYCTIHPREMRARIVVGTGTPSYGTGQLMAGGGASGQGQSSGGYGGYGGCGCYAPSAYRYPMPYYVPRVIVVVRHRHRRYHGYPGHGCFCG